MRTSRIFSYPICTILILFVLSPVFPALGQATDSEEGEKQSADKVEKKSNSQPSGQQTESNSEKGKETSLTLDQMIAIALKHNPDVRAAQAKLEMAQAELDRTRLEIVQKIADYRQRLQAQKNVVRVAERGVEITQKVPGAVPQAEEKLEQERAKLAAIETELPFLLGRPLDADESNLEDRDPQVSDKQTKLLRETICPMLKKLVETGIEDFRSGRSEISPVYRWSRRLMNVERKLAGTKAERLAAIETHLDRMRAIEEVAKALYEAGKIGSSAILAAQFYVKEAELWLMEERTKQ